MILHIKPDEMILQLELTDKTTGGVTLQASEASMQQRLGASAQQLAQSLAGATAHAFKGAGQGEAALPGIAQRHTAQAALLQDHTQVGGVAVRCSLSTEYPGRLSIK